jgi:hypothetical protein
MLVDKGPFRRLLRYCRPSLKESDIPHRTKMREEILQRIEVAEERLRSKLKVMLDLIHLIRLRLNSMACRISLVRFLSRSTAGLQRPVIRSSVLRATTSTRRPIVQKIGASSLSNLPTLRSRATTLVTTFQRSLSAPSIDMGFAGR